MYAFKLKGWGSFILYSEVKPKRFISVEKLQYRKAHANAPRRAIHVAVIEGLYLCRHSK